MGRFKACYKCDNRTVEPNCHTTCEEYLEEVNKNEKVKAKKREAFIIEDAVSHSMERMSKKYRRSDDVSRLYPNKR